MRVSTKTRSGIDASRRRQHDELLTLARTVRDGVLETFGVRLVPEPVLVGCSL
ncbi:UDP-N-acetylenolpyruvoylglucosamine reductase domain protein [Mycobacteroides abscessus]|nr:UDP-N-acetylenolpyruvoylglucosamine reductase domain protein [Mycobacteroides abscessus]